jgi:hypothetical protein
MTQAWTWRRGAAEGCVIVASILLAFWIDALWERRQVRELETEALSALAEEVATNRAQLQNVLDATEDRIARITQFLQATSGRLLAVPADSISSWVRPMHNTPIFSPSREASQRLTQMPVFGSDAIRARTLVSAWLREWDGGAVELERLHRRQDEVMRRLSVYAVSQRTAPFRMLPALVARSGPAVLVDLSEDEELVAAVIDKRQIQAVYRGDLRDALEALDALAVALSRPQNVR